MTAPRTEERPLTGKVALVAGATRGASRAVAVELGRAGAVVYVTGRSTRARRSEVGRPETIEETAERVEAAGGTAVAVAVDHLEPPRVEALVARIEAEQGRLDVLVNGLWGGDHLMSVADFGRKKMWEQDLEAGLRMLRLGMDSHLITSRYALPLLTRRPGGLVVEVTDGTAAYNARYRGHLYFDLAKYAPLRMAAGLGEELKDLGCTAVSFTPGYLRSEAMLDTYKKVTEETWRDALADDPHFCISESPTYSGRAVAALAADPDVARWNGQSLSSGQLARAYGFTDTDGTRPDAWGYIAALEAGEEPREEDYR
ncbi:short-chain dehydrogenase [Streptomyces mashuensis]|uniref:Short-chain dehydrogenase n=1 Tax=Streptomyces mashuensis TaxID=33904 RepID=A0A919EB62_9ACTN|nr:SDR family oxidoreductase [Streptomyces mashuensis]GHF32307.1 short-chain dehydrogenase [Streptomyces mashuensis]